MGTVGDVGNCNALGRWGNERVGWWGRILFQAGQWLAGDSEIGRKSGDILR